MAAYGSIRTHILYDMNHPGVPVGVIQGGRKIDHPGVEKYTKFWSQKMTKHVKNVKSVGGSGECFWHLWRVSGGVFDTFLTLFWTKQ